MVAYPANVVPVVPGLEWLPLQAASFANKKAFKAVTKSRPMVLLAFAEAGYATFYNDADTYWLRDALMEFDDLRRGGILGGKRQPHAVIVEDDPKRITEKNANYCTGILYLRPTRQVKDFLVQWMDEVENSEHDNDQPAFNAVMSRTSDSVLPRRVGSWDSFPPGGEYFAGRAGYDPNEHNVAVVHNNWILGNERKQKRFEDNRMWSPSGKLERQNCGSR
uniref:Nucleotide-diphospho-sugar transferase domain-containing protein n=1 Tax=Trieres chinensis TaxID=1514140 RepID=A0A7S2E9T1_TRICV|mmetsp:Transcript_13360/g.27580  ORF Transcript_13360/g.27580 Transcript_13360/m.27580 type:complete len:220 (+) Transcript_13360:199-858(+)